MKRGNTQPCNKTGRKEGGNNQEVGGNRSSPLNPRKSKAVLHMGQHRITTTSKERLSSPKKNNGEKMGGERNDISMRKKEKRSLTDFFMFSRANKTHKRKKDQ